MKKCHTTCFKLLTALTENIGKASKVFLKLSKNYIMCPGVFDLTFMDERLP